MFTRHLVHSAVAMVGVLALSGQPAHAIEEQTADWLIVNGQRIAEDSYPELVQILIPRPVGRRQMCTATIINENWVLTAAHCFDGINKDAKPGVVTYFQYDQYGNPTDREFASEGYIVHPWFLLKNERYPTWGNEYDVALIRMAEPITAPPGVTLPKANLPEPTDSIPTNGRAIVAGRGTYKFKVKRVKKGGKYIVDPLTMREAEVPITACRDKRQVCMNERYTVESFPYVPDKVSLHGQWHRQPSVCFGDSGGPLFAYQGNKRVQLGIANLMPASPEMIDFYEGDICGRTQVLYTSVGFVKPWIDRVMRDNLHPGDKAPTFRLTAPPVGGTASAHPQGGLPDDNFPDDNFPWDNFPDDGFSDDPFGSGNDVEGGFAIAGSGQKSKPGSAKQPGQAKKPGQPKRPARKANPAWNPPSFAHQATFGHWTGIGDRLVAVEDDSPAPYTWNPPSNTAADGSDLSIAVARLRNSAAAEQAKQSNHAAPKRTRALLASEDNMADALASGPLQADASLYLTKPDVLEDRVLTAFKAEGIKEVWILGGPKAVSPAVESALAKAGIATRRIAGADRTETARAIADVVAEQGTPASKNRFLARAFGTPGQDGQAWADSLALGVLAAKQQTPVLLTDTDKLSDAAKAQVKAGQYVSIVGGPQAVSAGVEAQVNALTGVQSKRVAGAGRAQTAAALQREFNQPKKAIVIDGDAAANGWQLGFVLAGLGADLNAPVVLTNGTNVPAETQAVLNQVAPKDVICIGSSATCDAVTALKE